MTFPLTGQVHVQICTKISVNKFWRILNSMWTDLLNKKTHQEFLDTTSDLGSPTAADHRKFSVKLALHVCPVLVHLLFISVGDKAVHNMVLCPNLLLSNIRKIQLYFLFQQLFKSANHSRMVCICLHLTMESCYPSTYTYQKYICSESSILSRFNGWSKMVITSNHEWMLEVLNILCSLYIWCLPKAKVEAELLILF